ncbi:MAG: MoaD/ThiS family protein [Betaproteobacteria bacterium]|nr:MoaD/ThiS family protein [Betaproteobacteria bacterium]
MNINIRLNLLGVLDLKQSELDLDVAAGTTVATLLDLIDQRNPGFREALTGEDGGISKQFVFFINGRNVVQLEGMKTPLAAGDAVNVIPAIAGG